MTDTSKPTVTITGLTAGTYVFRLRVIDNDGASDSNDMILTVNPGSSNMQPISNAGADHVVTLPKNVFSIVGSGSDADGTITSYSWTKVSGGAVTLLNPTSPTLALEDLVAGTYVFQLTVKDNYGATHSDNMNLVVNIAPVVSAGADQTVTLPDDNVTLYGSASDEDGSIRGYSWVKVSGGSAVMSGNLTPTVTISDLQEGTYVFKLNAKDNLGSSRYDEVTVIVRSGSSTARVAFDDEVPIEEETFPVDEDGTSIVGALSQPEKKFWSNKQVVLYDDQGNRIHDGGWSAKASEELFNRKGFFVYHIVEKGITLRRGKIYLVE
jgi:hypothetical protein